MQKFKIACEASDITIKETKDYTKGLTVAIVSVKHASQLYEAGLIQAELNDDEPKD